ncbi:MAG: hypothetical protein LBB61_08210 [Treponema sp.]|jgi:hypothetical protein|nr:hypothetical protein [Treponema sp.]
MSDGKDWFPKTRVLQRAMAKNWVIILKVNAATWNIAMTVVTDLETRTDAADAALTAAQNEETRTPVATARCRETFKALEECMRDIKKRYFFIPPLTEADFAGLGLKVPDSTATPSGTPTAQVTLETCLVGRHELGIKIVYVTGSPHDAANKGYRIWYSVTGQGETPPANPDELRGSFFTKRKKDLIEFGFGDSGKTAYFAVQIENDGKKGPWGPLVNALIP